MLLVGTIMFAACNNDSDPVAPTIDLESTTIAAQAGESISVEVSVNAPEGFDRLEIEKQIDGQTIETETVNELNNNTLQFEYTVLVEDSDGILTFVFTVFDNAELSASVDLIVEVELTPTQVLLRYDWLLSEEIRQRTNENDVADAYTDDVYRFYESGEYDKSIGDKADDFGDAWFNHCFWNLDDDNVLIMTRTGAFGEDVRDTLNVTTLNSDEMRADVTYYGLDAFNTGSEDVPYESVEQYEKVFTAQPRSNNFDPYGPGADNDAGPAGTCNQVSF